MKRFSQDWGRRVNGLANLSEGLSAPSVLSIFWVEQSNQWPRVDEDHRWSFFLRARMTPRRL